ncbi:MAG TPA: diacylglycerol kinase family protein [Acidimicrobiales bacterium]|jgi:undecaprenyl-diphosphatase|nr:diacylglycerol kinase family protein [Acidimicrobiales bacterium]
MPGVVLVNPESGPGQTAVADLRARFEGHTVEEIEPDRLDEQVDKAVADGADFVGVAGGDGTVRAVAERLVALGADTPLLPVPTGTRNHFAKDVGLPSVEDAAAAARAGRAGRVIGVDVGRVNGRCFVNNSSVGVYPKIVVRREIREHRLRKPVATVVAAWEQLRHGRRVDVTVDGEPHAAWLVFVGNGRYGKGLLDLADRESLDEHVLDLRVVRADRPLARMRVAGALLLGRLARSPLLFTKTATAATVDMARPRVEVALDGEVFEVDTPLRYESLPLALRVLVG